VTHTTHFVLNRPQTALTHTSFGAASSECAEKLISRETQGLRNAQIADCLWLLEEVEERKKNKQKANERDCGSSQMKTASKTHLWPVCTLHQHSTHHRRRVQFHDVSAVNLSPHVD
jgi:hypothetical protein